MRIHRSWSWSGSSSRRPSLRVAVAPPNPRGTRHRPRAGRRQACADFAVAAAANGKGKVALSNLRGKVGPRRLLGTFCEPCKKSFPKLQDLNTKYAASGLKIVGISEDEPDDKDRPSRASRHLRREVHARLGRGQVDRQELQAADDAVVLPHRPERRRPVRARRLPRRRRGPGREGDQRAARLAEALLARVRGDQALSRRLARMSWKLRRASPDAAAARVRCPGARSACARRSVARTRRGAGAGPRCTRYPPRGAPRRRRRASPDCRRVDGMRRRTEPGLSSGHHQLDHQLA